MEEQKIDDDFKTYLEDKKTEILSNDMLLARIFIKCYDFLLVYSELEDVKKIIDKCSFASDLRFKIGCYYEGKEFGDWLIAEKIRSLVNKNRKEISELIKFFYDKFIE